MELPLELFSCKKHQAKLYLHNIMKVVLFTHPSQLYEGQTAHHTIGIGMKWVMVNLLGIEPSNSIRVLVVLALVIVFGNRGGYSTDTDTHNARCYYRKL